MYIFDFIPSSPGMPKSMRTRTPNLRRRRRNLAKSGHLPPLLPILPSHPKRLRKPSDGGSVYFSFDFLGCQPEPWAGNLHGSLQGRACFGGSFCPAIPIKKSSGACVPPKCHWFRGIFLFTPKILCSKHMLDFSKLSFMAFGDWNSSRTSWEQLMVWNYHAVKYLGFRPKTMKKNMRLWTLHIYTASPPTPYSVGWISTPVKPGDRKAGHAVRNISKDVGSGAMASMCISSGCDCHCWWCFSQFQLAAAI